MQRCYNGDTLAYWWGWVLKKSHTIFNTRLIFGSGRIAFIYQFACFIFYVYVFFAALDRYSYLKMKTLPLKCSICSTYQEIDWNWPIMYTQKQLNSTLLYRKPRPHSMPRATNKVSHTKASPPLPIYRDREPTPPSLIILFSYPGSKYADILIYSL